MSPSAKYKDIYRESGAERNGAEDLGAESNSQTFTDESRRSNEAIEAKIGTWAEMSTDEQIWADAQTSPETQGRRYEREF